MAVCILGTGTGGRLKGTTEVIISPHNAVCYGSYENGTFAFLTTGVNPKTFAKYSTLPFNLPNFQFSFYSGACEVGHKIL